MKKLILGILSAGFVSQALASETGPLFLPSCWSFVATLSAGPVWEKAGKTQTFYLAEDIEKTYDAYKSTDTLFDGEVFLGAQARLYQSLLGQLGVAVVATNNAPLSGDIWDDASPEFNNYDYRYKIQHTHIALKSKVLLDMDFWLIPWVSGSVAVGFNTAHDYSNTPTIEEALPNPNFSSHTQTAFSYTLGTGVQAVLNKHWQVGVGYEFADWGKSRLGRADGQTENSGLSLNHLYTNGVLFNITFIS